MADIGLEYAFYEVDEKIRYAKILFIEQIHDIQVSLFHFLSHLTGWQIAISFLLVITLTLFVRLSIQPLSDLRFRYSLLSCWKELLVMMDRSHCQPFLLRLAFADAVTYDHTISDWPYCGGCNGSIRFDSELNEPFNAGMVNAISILLPFKRRYGKLISWADLIQMAGAAAVYSLGGPYIELRYGREDVDVDLRCLTLQEEVRHRIANGASFHTPTSEDLQANIVFPKVFPPYPRGEMRAEQHLRSIFQRLGLTNREAVALMGAHTCGRAFQDRSGCCPFSSGDQGATIYTKLTAEAHGTLKPPHKDIGIPGGCSWTKNWLQFDNSYFRRPLDDPSNEQLLWLPTDQALLDCPDYRTHFLAFANDRELFFEQYKSAHRRMSELGARFSRIAIIPFSPKPSKQNSASN